MRPRHRILSPNEPDPTAARYCALTVMTKAPLAGQVKTRLSPPLTAEEAAMLNVCFLRDTAASISEVRDGAKGIGCYAPIGAESVYDDILPADFQLIPQRGDSFGERLLFAFEDLLQVGFASVCLIDSDSPTVSADTFAEAAARLAQPGDRMVLGPTDDGGYYLIGLKKLHRRIFDDIEWSTDRVFAQTRARAAELNLDVHLLPAGYDVDERVTLRRLCQELFQPNDQHDDCVAPATRKFLSEIIASEGRERIWPAEASLLSSR